MVGIALFPFRPKFVSLEDPTNQKRRPLHSRIPGIAAPFDAADHLLSAGVHALKDLLRLLAFAVCLSVLDARARWQIPV
jgi:hypothetical protein